MVWYDRNMWLKHVSGYAVHNAINLHTCALVGRISHEEPSVRGHESLTTEINNFKEYLSFPIQRDSNL